MFVSLYTMSIPAHRQRRFADRAVRVLEENLRLCVRLDGQTLTVLAGQIDVLGYGGAYRDRTDDPLLAKQVLSQLS